MNDKILIETNLWIYLYALNPQAKRNRIEELVQQNFANIIVSTQILGELYHVVTRKGLLTYRGQEIDVPREGPHLIV